MFKTQSASGTVNPECYVSLSSFKDGDMKRCMEDLQQENNNSSPSSFACTSAPNCSKYSTTSFLPNPNFWEEIQLLCHCHSRKCQSIPHTPTTEGNRSSREVGSGQRPTTFLGRWGSIVTCKPMTHTKRFYMLVMLNFDR